ncbi:MAG: hypothetical protein WB586_11800 [Chthoniobacterales bacterium]
MSRVQPETSPFPEGYGRVLLREEDLDSPLAICLLARAGITQSPPLILLRETLDASIYLGCVVDRAGDPKQWVEIWVQDVDRLMNSFRAQLEALTNALLDRRWIDRATMFRSLDRAALIETGWESNHPAPAFVDPKNGKIVHPIEPITKQPFVLCQDDNALRTAGLPSYSSSLHRYLWNGPTAANPVFLAATSDAPTAPEVKSVKEVFGALLPFNPGGGLLLVRSLCPLTLTEFADILAGKPWPGFSSSRVSLRLDGAYSQLGDLETLLQHGAHLFSGRIGRAGRLLEVFHLKLNLVLQVLSETRAAIHLQQLPFLTLGAESFRVRLSETGTGLPFFWTAHLDLVESSGAIPLPIETSGSRYFIPPVLPGASIYRPPTLSMPVAGEATVRIREVLPKTADGIGIEATLATDERLKITASDLIHIRLSLPIGRVDLYGRLNEAQALAKGESRLRTLPQKLPDNVRTALEQAAGASITKANFEILPLLSSPCDLYATAVLASRILLVDEENTLAIALDEMLSLARQLAAEYTTDTPFRDRLRAITQRDPRWTESLGPYRLVRDSNTREIAAQIVPPELWWDTIGNILRLFPGVGPDSYCRDFGHAPPLALDRIFDEPIAALDLLQLRSRSLLVTDWNRNAEVQDAIEAILSLHRSQNL